MKITNKAILSIALIFAAFGSVAAQTELPNGWKISPIGEHCGLGDLPLQMIADPSGEFLFITNAGQSDHSIMVYDVKRHKIVDSMPVKATFYGLVYDDVNGHLYSSGANLNIINRFEFKAGKLRYLDSIHLGETWPEVKISPTGMYIHQASRSLFFATKENASLYKVSLNNFSDIKRWDLPSAGYAVTGDGKDKLFVSHWGDTSIGIFQISTGQWIKKVRVGDNPNEMIYDKLNDRLFVACADDNTVHMVSMTNGFETSILKTGFEQTNLTGSGSNALCLSPSNNMLLVANADNNCLVVFAVNPNKSPIFKGLIPTGWYPTQVSWVGNDILVCNGKGLNSLPNPMGPNPMEKKTKTVYQQGQKNSVKVQYIGSLFRGSLQRFESSELLKPKNLKKNTQTVFINTPYRLNRELEASIPRSNPVPSMVGDSSPIKYVFYIVKENRTYDQVLSDIPGGDGDTSLLLFGEEITPIQHELCREFVLLDHFYVDAEVSADGHNWSTAAYANDYTEKTWPTHYGGRGGDYVYEGQSTIAHPQKGFIWDHAKSAGITYRSYGEFADNYKANIPSLENQFCQYFTSWDESIRDTSRFYQWKRDFDSLLLINKVPQLNTLRFINDHTEGVRKNRPTPFAHIADNDLAVGLFVDYLSRSSIWDQSVVFILEDDAQNGADHIDAHRSTAYLAGGFVKRGFVDHTHYSTSSMLRTIELVLGMKPMSQYDAAAEPMWRCFADTINRKTFNYKPAKIDLNAVNNSTDPKATSFLMKMSESLNLSKEDVADENLMNTILWKYVRGEKAELPQLKRAAWVRSLHLENN